MLQSNPNDAFLRHALGLELMKIGEWEQAKNTFAKLLTDEPDYVGTYYHFGKIFEYQRDITKAIEVYHKGMEIAKKINDRHAYNELQQVVDLLND